VTYALAPDAWQKAADALLLIAVLVSYVLHINVATQVCLLL
jgi:hypothetical protein